MSNIIFKDTCLSDIEKAKKDGPSFLNILEGKPSLKAIYEDMKIVGEVSKLLFFDTETSHLNGYIVSIAMILTDLEGNILEEKYMLLNPGVEIADETYEIHKISNDDVKNKPSFKECYLEIEDFFKKGDNLVAHNINYDIGVLIREYERIGKIFPEILKRKLDTMEPLKYQVKFDGVKVKFPNLGECADMLNITNDKETLHNALVDTRLLVKVYSEAIKCDELVLNSDIIERNSKK